MRFTKSAKTGGWTLVELLVAVGIVVIVIGITVAALATSKSDSKRTGAEGTAKTVNDAILRAYLKGDTNPAIYGNSADDITTAVAYLQEQGYLK